MRTRDVHVRAVDVFARGQEEAVLDLLAHPWPVAPGEEYEVQLVGDIRVADVEVVLQRADVYVAIELRCMVIQIAQSENRGATGTDVLLHVLVSGHDGALADLEAHLGGRVVHDAPEGRVHEARAALGRAGLLRVSIGVRLGLLLRLRRRGAAEIGYLTDAGPNLLAAACSFGGEMRGGRAYCWGTGWWSGGECAGAYVGRCIASGFGV